MNIIKTYEASDLRLNSFPREFIIRADDKVAPAAWLYCAADMWLVKVHTEIDAVAILAGLITKLTIAKVTLFESLMIEGTNDKEES